jgi:hypothetical protein
MALTYGTRRPPSPGYTKKTGSTGALRSFKKVQRIAALAITGTLRTSLNDYVDAHAGILPMELALLKACHSALVRTLTLPSTNPVHQVAQAAKRTQPRRHSGPIDNLLRIFRLRNVETETIHPAITLKSLSPQHRIEIDNSREDSINLERTDDAD